MWLSVDPMADKYPSLSPYNYCAWNPVKLVDPDGREIHIVGDKQYQARVTSLLNQLANSGLAGKYLVYKAMKSKNTFTFIQPRENSDLPEHEVSHCGKNNEMSAILFDAYSSGNFDEANGGVEKTPLTTMAHELAHFVFPNDGFLLKDGYSSDVRAGEVKAVEWENMVREDLGMSLRKKYAGVDVFGKGISPVKRYRDSYVLTKSKTYMQRPEDVGGFRAPKERLSYVYYYKINGRGIQPPPNSYETRYRL